MVNYKRDAANQMKSTYYEIAKKQDFPSPTTEVIIANHLMIQSKTEDEIIEIVKDHLNDNEELRKLFNYHKLLLYYGMILYRYIITGILFSSFAMLLGIISLSIGGLIPEDAILWRWIIISLESFASIIALIFAIFATIRMVQGCDNEEIEERRKKFNLLDKTSLMSPSIFGLDKRKTASSILQTFLKLQPNG